MRARADGAIVEIDVAVEAEDQNVPVLSVYLLEPLVKALASVDVRFVVTVYPDSGSAD